MSELGATSGLEGVPSAGLHLTVAAVARRLGVAPATLRTWDRRYGLGPSEHTAGRHRRYSPTDVARLETMQRLLRMGGSPAESARAAQALEPHQLAAPIAGPAGGRQGGGQVVAIPGGTPTARGLARAALSLDSAACAEILEGALNTRGVAATWNQVLVPVLGAVGQRWQGSQAGVEVEHLLSETVMAALVVRGQAPDPAVNQRSVLLAGAPDDLHSLPLYAVAAALAERRVSSRVLGARVPDTALASAVRRTGPGAVLIWAHARSTAEASHWADLLEVSAAPEVLLGGPGWDAVPDAVDHRVSSLDEAVEVIVSAVVL